MTWNPILPATVYDRLPELSESAVKVAVVLARYADASGESFPNQETIAADSGLSRRAVHNGIDRLRDLGLLDVAPGRGRGITSVYQWSEKVHIEAEKGNARAPFSEKKGAHSDKKRCTSAHAYKEELSSNYPSAPKQKSKGASTTSAVTWTGDSFDAPDALRQKWEAAYPGVDLDRELAKAEGWYLANPSKRKKNHARFLTGWLSRAKPAPADDPDAAYAALIREKEADGTLEAIARAQQEAEERNRRRAAQ